MFFWIFGAQIWTKFSDRNVTSIQLLVKAPQALRLAPFLLTINIFFNVVFVLLLSLPELLLNARPFLVIFYKASSVLLNSQHAIIDIGCAGALLYFLNRTIAGSTKQSKSQVKEGAKYLAVQSSSS